MTKEWMGNEKKEEEGKLKEGKEKGSKKNNPYPANPMHKIDMNDKTNVVECEHCGSKKHKTSAHKAKGKALEGMKK